MRFQFGVKLTTTWVFYIFVYYLGCVFFLWRYLNALEDWYKSAHLVSNAGYLKPNVRKRGVFCLPFPCKRAAGTLMSLCTSFSPQQSVNFPLTTQLIIIRGAILKPYSSEDGNMSLHRSTQICGVYCPYNFPDTRAIKISWNNPKTWICHCTPAHMYVGILSLQW
jgi:hypothetical protein